MSDNPMIDGRRADSGRRRQRVLSALHNARDRGEQFSVSAIARAARVDRTFLYRHPDLLEQIHTAQAHTIVGDPRGRTVSRASLQTDLANAADRAARQAARIQQLEHKLAELLGEHAWHQSGLGAPSDTDHGRQRITDLEQQVVDLQRQLDERDRDLEAARAANRDLIVNLNRGT
jgi:hypothetical protein